MSDMEHKSELESLMDSTMKLTSCNIRTILDEWDKDMPEHEVDKLHHLMEIMYYARAMKPETTMTK